MSISRINLKTFVVVVSVVTLTVLYQNCGGGGGGGGGSKSSPATAANKKSCQFSGQDMLDGDSVTAYVTSSVPFGQSCAQEERVCNDGVLSGTFEYLTCGVGVAASCLIDGKTVAHGSSIATYTSRTVPYFNTCSPTTRLCNNGVLSGNTSSVFTTCAPDPAPGNILSMSCSLTPYSGNKPSIVIDGPHKNDVTYYMTLKEYTFGGGIPETEYPLCSFAASTLLASESISSFNPPYRYFVPGGGLGKIINIRVCYRNKLGVWNQGRTLQMREPVTSNFNDTGTCTASSVRN
jgi:hypothetical protein